MINAEIQKRETSFLILFLIIGLYFFSIFIFENFILDDDKVLDNRIITIFIVTTVIFIIFGEVVLIKASYHWCLAKGYPGEYCLFALLGPIGLIIIANLEDKASDDEDMQEKPT